MVTYFNMYLFILFFLIAALESESSSRYIFILDSTKVGIKILYFGLPFCDFYCQTKNCCNETTVQLCNWINCHYHYFKTHFPSQESGFKLWFVEVNHEL